MLFVTVACGAISGFHSLVSSGTTSKQIDNERDAKKIGYGGMLIEGVLAVVALITAAYLTQGGIIPTIRRWAGKCIYQWSRGVHIRLVYLRGLGKLFVALAVSALH